MHDHITGNATFSRIIEVIVSPQGETRVETKGFFGSACQQASRFVELALGERTAEQLTTEFHQSQSARHSHQQRV